MKQKILVSLVALFLCLGGLALTSCGTSGSSGSSSSDSSTTETNSNDTNSQEVASPEPTPSEITFDTPFEFDDLTITFHSNMSSTVLENQFSDQNGATVISVPISVTNNSSDTKGLNMFYFKIYGPDGTELDTISSYFMDDDIEWAGEARSGATIESNMHILYAGDGDYYVEFDKIVGDKVEVRLPITAV